MGKNFDHLCFLLGTCAWVLGTLGPGHRSFLIKRDPVRSVFVAGGHFALWVKHLIILHLSAYRSCAAILDDQHLAKAHIPTISLSWEIILPHELPLTFAPYKTTSISLASITLYHLPVADMVIRNVRVSELFQQLSCKCSLATR